MKKLSMQDIQDTRNEIKKQHFTIVNYILNKNSHSLKEGGMDYKKLAEDLEDFESYLADSIY